MLYFIGLGLGDVEDITVKGLKIVRDCSRVYLEAYTSILTVGKEELEKYYGKTLILADREMVEQQSDEIIQGADEEDIAFLVVGDPFGATTHTDLILRAKEKGINYRVIHNASILNAAGCCGLQLYNFGETVSIVFWTESWKPQSFYDKIMKNLNAGLHTLCLLDIKVKEQSIENMMRGRKIFEPPRYMLASQAASQLLEIVREKQADKEATTTAQPALTPSTPCIALARVGWEDQVISVLTLEQMVDCDIGGPLHTLVIPGHLHPLELDMLKHFTENPQILPSTDT